VPDNDDPDWSTLVDALYRRDGRRVFATLVRLLRDFDRAEEALHDAFRSALETWPRTGVPANPLAWLIASGRHQAIDHLRRHRRLRPLAADEHDEPDADDGPGAEAGLTDHRGERAEPDELVDDRLRLIFTCCHPSLGDETRLPLTLREVCGLTTEQIARAFVVPAPTIAQRIVRAKAKIRAAGIPFEVPPPADLPARLPSVLRVVYLVFTEGHNASSGPAVLQIDLAEEAIRLARLLHDLLPEPPVAGLLALLLLQQARTGARVDADGGLVPLESQDRSRWDRARIVEGCELVERALRAGPAHSYTVQAAIAAVHAEATTAAATDWPQIRGLYDVLWRLEPQPVVALNRAVAVAMAGDLARGIAAIDEMLPGPLATYHLAHAAHADLCRRAGRVADARTSYGRALALAAQGPERAFLARRLAELDLPDGGAG
jgi:RNA polymerase sigma-70 factor (ECF subfamily)